MIYDDADGLSADQQIVDDVDGGIPGAAEAHLDVIEAARCQRHALRQRARVGAEVTRDIGGNIRPPVG